MVPRIFHRRVLIPLVAQPSPVFRRDPQPCCNHPEQKPCPNHPNNSNTSTPVTREQTIGTTHVVIRLRFRRATKRQRLSEIRFHRNWRPTSTHKVCSDLPDVMLPGLSTNRFQHMVGAEPLDKDALSPEALMATSIAEFCITTNNFEVFGT